MEYIHPIPSSHRGPWPRTRWRRQCQHTRAPWPRALRRTGSQKEQTSCKRRAEEYWLITLNMKFIYLFILLLLLLLLLSLQQ